MRHLAESSNFSDLQKSLSIQRYQRMAAQPAHMLITGQPMDSDPEAPISQCYSVTLLTRARPWMGLPEASLQATSSSKIVEGVGRRPKLDDIRVATRRP